VDDLEIPMTLTLRQWKDIANALRATAKTQPDEVRERMRATLEQVAERAYLAASIGVPLS
jgi:hypothetical protein